jgi:hypothetical protein
MLIKFDVKCDNIVLNNFTDLTSKNSSNPILIKEKITPIENLQNNNNIKYNVIGPTSNNNSHHVFNKTKKTNMGYVSHNKNVLKPFNRISRNEEHLNNFVPLMKENRASTIKFKKNLDKKNDDKNIIKYKKISKTLLNMHAIVVKHCVLHFKFFLKIIF